MATLPALAGAVDLDALVKNSPFGEGKGATIAEKPSNLEFRGMYVDHGVTYFSIYNTTTKLSAWVAQGEAPAGLVPVTVKSYDADTDSIILENAGQPVKLSLKTAVIGVAPAAGVPMPQVAAVADPNQQPQQFGGFKGGFNGGQPPTPEQIAAFREQMKQRGMERQNGGAVNGEGGVVPTEGGKRDRGNFSRGGEAAAVAPATNAAPTGNTDRGGRTRGGK
ncbi:MAG: hypothetical protein RL492_1563 [Verrucomicrobiota bacterium]